MNKSETLNLIQQISDLDNQITNLNKHLNDTETKNEQLSVLLQSKEIELDNSIKENDDILKERRNYTTEVISLKETIDMLTKSVQIKESEFKELENKLSSLHEE